MLTLFNGYFYVLSGLPFIPYLDNLPNFNRSVDGPIRLPIVDKYKVPKMFKKLCFMGSETVVLCFALNYKTILIT